MENSIIRFVLKGKDKVSRFLEELPISKAGAFLPERETPKRISLELHEISGTVSYDRNAVMQTIPEPSIGTSTLEDLRSWPSEDKSYIRGAIVDRATEHVIRDIREKVRAEVARNLKLETEVRDNTIIRISASIPKIYCGYPIAEHRPLNTDL